MMKIALHGRIIEMHVATRDMRLSQLWDVRKALHEVDWQCRGQQGAKPRALLND